MSHTRVSRHLVIVESPAKARSIQKYLGADYQVIASMGHVMDLTKKEGVTIEKKGGKYNFTLLVTPIKEKAKVIEELRKAAGKAQDVFLASDPDREGEVISYHVAQLIKDKVKKPEAISRVLFHEITPAAVKEAFAHPRAIDMKLVESQQSRRVLDRIVGFDVSQLLWEKVARGLSAGRVQSVALRLVVEREREIRRFVTVEYWSLSAELEKDKMEFEARLFTVDGKKTSLPDEKSAKAILARLKDQTPVVTRVETSERRRFPTAPFITSTLQQEAARRIGLPVAITMKLAQGLYEGVELGAEGPTGLITYMRTDSVRVSQQAIEEARAYIKRRVGAAYLPEKPIIYKTKKSAQDAHEAIRPTSVDRTPSSVAPFLDSKSLHLYRLIWTRFVASQCNPAVYDNVSVDLEAAGCLFRATGATVKFKGFLKVYGDIETDDKLSDDEETSENVLPPLVQGDKPNLRQYTPLQHFTQPPPRYSEAALVKALEEKSIGRPSTYASIIATLKNRAYTHVERKRLFPTDLGMSVLDLLVESFPDIFNVGFTAEMEQELDEVEEGTLDWQKTLNNFYTEFIKDMKIASQRMPNLKAGVPTEHICPTCNAVMNLRYGRNGRFLACSTYPDCMTTFEVNEDKDGKLLRIETPKFDTVCPKCSSAMNFKRSRFGAFLACSLYPECKGALPLKKVGENQYELEPVEIITRPCPDCGGKLIVKRSRFGRFLACDRYPECKGALPYFINVRCPRQGCDGELVERTAKRGLQFTCHNYPECRFRSFDTPIAVSCPKCGAPSMFLGKGGIKCAREGCDGHRDEEPTSENPSGE